MLLNSSPMKEFDENDAVKAMMAVLAPGRADEDAVFEILDLLFEAYDELGMTEVSLDAPDADPEISELIGFIRKYLTRHKAAVDFTDAELEAMIEAENAYEESLL